MSRLSLHGAGTAGRYKPLWMALVRLAHWGSRPHLCPAPAQPPLSSFRTRETPPSSPPPFHLWYSASCPFAVNLAANLCLQPLLLLEESALDTAEPYPPAATSLRARSIMGDPRDSSSYSVVPRIRYNTIGGVNGPLVILENVRGNAPLAIWWRRADEMAPGQIPEILRDCHVDTTRWNGEIWSGSRSSR